MKLTFLGAADTVTGSRHLIEVKGRKILLDCGLFQGYKTLRERNWQAFPIPPKDIDAVILSHAHIDHSGYLPALCRDGFRGPIYCSRATRDLTELLLADSAHLMEEEADRANRHGYSKHTPARPLYTLEDVNQAMRQFRPIGWNQTAKVDSIEVQLQPSGHLLGAASICVRVKNRSLVFSGDLGRQHDVLMSPPSTLKSADVMIVESTYGNRRHPAEDSDSRLANIIRDTFARGGTILIPTFAVGRAQALLLSIARLKQQQRIPDLPVFVDSPMASRATQLYKEHAKGLRISSKELRMLCDCAKHVSSADESKKVTELAHPAIVLAGSGMATGGRILHHLRARASDPNAHIVFPGFQVPGTRGAKLVAGDRAIKIFGEHVRVNAEVSQLESLSGHADADEIMQWLSAIKRPPQHTFVVHGERGASDALRSRIHHELGWNASAVDFLQHVTI